MYDKSNVSLNLRIYSLSIRLVVLFLLFCQFVHVQKLNFNSTSYSMFNIILIMLDYSKLCLILEFIVCQKERPFMCIVCTEELSVYLPQFIL